MLVQVGYFHPPLQAFKSFASGDFFGARKRWPHLQKCAHDLGSLVSVILSVVRSDPVDGRLVARDAQSAHDVDVALLDPVASAGSANHLFYLACADIVLECEDNNDCILCELEVETASIASTQ